MLQMKAWSPMDDACVPHRQEFGCVCIRVCVSHERLLVWEKEEEAIEMEEDNGMVGDYGLLHTRTHHPLNACLQTHFRAAGTLCYLPQPADI